MYRIGYKKMMFHRIFSPVVLFVISAFLLSCVSTVPDQTQTAVSLQPEINSQPEPEKPDPAALLFKSLTPEEQIGQLFIVEVRDPSSGTFLKEVTSSYSTWAQEIQPGGFILFAENLQDPLQTKKLIRDLNSLTRVPPFIALDEEGGVVSRLGKVPAMQATPIPASSRIGASGDSREAEKAARIIAKELRDLGFSIDFAPVADVHVPGSGGAIGPRSYGTDPELVAQMASAFSRGLEEEGILSVAKHFPGHGAAAGDSHNQKTILNADIATLETRELIPFKAAVENHVGGIMLGHIMVPALEPHELPASLSPNIATELLRNNLGFEGLIFTDSLRMRGVTAFFRPNEIPLLAFEAGADMLLMPEQPMQAWQRMLDAYHVYHYVEKERLDASLERILKAKRQFLSFP